MPETVTKTSTVLAQKKGHTDQARWIDIPTINPPLYCELILNNSAKDTQGAGEMTLFSTLTLYNIQLQMDQRATRRI